MFDKSIIQKMKQTNISVDMEKTKERAERVWKNASKADRAIVLELADVKGSTVQRAYRTGSISAKLVVALSQTLNITLTSISFIVWRILRIP